MRNAEKSTNNNVQVKCVKSFKFNQPLESMARDEKAKNRISEL